MKTLNAFRIALVLFIGAIVVFLASCQSNTQHNQKDWTVLFDGKDVSQWRGINNDTFPDKGWIVKDGLLTTDSTADAQGDIITRKQYSNFELTLEFKLTEKANSGIKYFVVESLSAGGKSGIGLEYQILDDAGHPDAKAGKNGNRTNGSLYDLIAAPADKPEKPIGEWNTARIIAKGNIIEQWLNGKKIIEYKRDDPAFRKLVAESKYKDFPDFGLAGKGHILLQYHGDKVYFRNIRIRELQSAKSVFTAAQSSDANINPDLLAKRWQASWVSHPTASPKDYGVFHFRRTFDLETQPEKFVIHVSADNRYHLFVNGQSVCRGPARGDFMHWRFETVDIAPYFVKGKNTIAAVVWNFGELIPGAQMTLRTALVLQADDSKFNFVNTDQKWKVIQNLAYSPVSPSLNSFNFVGPGEKIIADKYPWDWQQTDFNDTDWLKVRPLDKAVPPGVATDNTWMLVPRTIPFMEDKSQRIEKIRRAAGVEINDFSFDGQHKLIVPANTRATILFDQTFLTTAYPELSVSGGKDSQISLTYSEALFDSKMQKSNRDEIEGRKIYGFTDIFLPDGDDNRDFGTLWFRTWRYLQMDIQTKDEPLTINDFYGRFTAYPFKESASFSSSDPSIKNIWDVGWRTARLCAGETYYDCPYYEQLQYVGDTRIQALISLYVSGDDRLMRNTISTFDDSRVADGLTQSRYPCSSMQIIPPYSLFWVAMVHDYWMHRDDPQFVKSFLPGIDAVLNWHEKYIDSNGMLGAAPWWNFVDWSWKWDTNKGIGGVPPLDSQGRSSILTLQYVYALNYAAQLNDNFGRHGTCPASGKYFADHYRKLADSLKKSTYKLCWDDKRGLLADTPDKKIFSQHANILAVLVDLVPPNEQKKLMEKVVSEKNLTQCTFYYRYYLIRAANKVGFGDRYIEMLQPWRDMLKIGLTTFAENPEPTRSDCHAWSASPNYDLLATVCGIMPAEPGFKSVKIEPHLGPLIWVEGKMPHPLGEISVRLERDGKTGIKGSITLPPGLTGKFLWNGKSIPLKPGPQIITL